MAEPENKAPDNVAELQAEAKKEPIASFLNMKLLELKPGYAKVILKVLPEHQNFNGVTFGGIIMAVADQAFAYTVNSVRRPNVASQFNIHFIAPARAGDELIAEGRVVKSGRRVSIAEMTVTNQDGKLIARATGTTIPLEQNQ
ncbi:MAG: PaaI family thioesterase [Chloroflexi bacterium]|nr:PaaI family thioesterase [Chloroflexota bacterium]